jgi:EAL and modified HD-GYP domain-containing signal transduction protein
MSHEVLFARQPIYDRENAIYGFELLYRGDLLLPSGGQTARATRATTEVLVNYCTGLIEDDATLGCPIFLNVDEEFITSKVFLPISPENLVIEVLETVKPTPEVIDSLTTLRKQGYKLALDDFIFTPGSEAFFPLMSIIKIDVLGMDMSTLKDNLEQFNFSKKILLAEKVEDEATYKICKELGFDLFQGYYLERPTIIEGRNFTGSKQTLLNLVSELCKDDVSVLEVSDLISADPSLVLKILKIINCPFYPFQREITNLREAVIKLGIVVVKQWAIILSLVASSEQPTELFRTLLVRAKVCHLFALSIKHENADDYFVIGLFSGLDAVLGIDMHTLLNNINFPSHVTEELLSLDRGEESILAMVIGYEKGRFLSARVADKLDKAYWESILWADELMKFVAPR